MQDPIQKTSKTKKAGGVAQGVQHLLSKPESPEFKL
jgi:hypothetical protein